MIEFVEMKNEDIARCVDIYIEAFEYTSKFKDIKEYSKIIFG